MQIFPFPLARYDGPWFEKICAACVVLRYRNPLFTAFAHKYEEHAAQSQEEAAKGSDQISADIEGSASTAAATDRTKRSGVRRSFLLAYMLRCNPQLAQYISDQVSPAEVLASCRSRPIQQARTSRRFSCQLWTL